MTQYRLTTKISQLRVKHITHLQLTSISLQGWNLNLAKTNIIAQRLSIEREGCFVRGNCLYARAKLLFILFFSLGEPGGLLCGTEGWTQRCHHISDGMLWLHRLLDSKWDSLLSQPGRLRRRFRRLVLPFHVYCTVHFQCSEDGASSFIPKIPVKYSAQFHVLLRSWYVCQLGSTTSLWFWWPPTAASTLSSMRPSTASSSRESDVSFLVASNNHQMAPALLVSRQTSRISSHDVSVFNCS